MWYLWFIYQSYMSYDIYEFINVHMNPIENKYDIYDSYLNNKFLICIWTFMNSFISSMKFYCSTTDEMLVVTSGSKLINFYILIVLFSVSPFVYFSILFEFISGLFHCSYLFKSFKFICWMDGFDPPPLGRISI